MLVIAESIGDAIIIITGFHSVYILGGSGGLGAGLMFLVILLSFILSIFSTEFQSEFRPRGGSLKKQGSVYHLVVSCCLLTF